MREHYILTNALVSDGLTFVKEHAALEVKGTRIRKIGDAAEFTDSGIRKIDLGGRLVLPGLLNPHHHLYSALATGLAPAGPTDNFEQVLNNLWWRLDRSLDEESIYCSALSGLMQSLRYGVTTVIDHHASMNCVRGSLNIIKSAFEKLGLKGLLCYEASDRMGEAALQEHIDENIAFYTESRGDASVRGLFGMHANFTLSEKSMQRIADARSGDMPVHIHCGEDAVDLAFCKRKGYAGPVDRLKAFGLLDENSLLAHCIHLSDRDHRLLKETGAVVVSNPESNATNNVGMMRTDRIPRYVLGTDGMTGNILGTARSHFLRRNGNIHDPQDMLFRYPAEITARYFPGYGTLKAGGKADIAVTNYRPVTPVHTGNLFYHIVFGVQGKEMYMTVSGGKVVFSDNTLHTVDETAVNREISRTVKKLYKTYGD